MNGSQLQITLDGQVKDKVEIAIQRLRAFEPPEGYYLAFSGGKDSQTVYHLAKMAGVKFDAHYSVTSVDPPELIYFIRGNYPDVKFERKHDSDGKPVTMWSLIVKLAFPPTRMQRFCCKELKESSGIGRVTITGVRWAESVNRRNTHDVVDMRGKKPIEVARQVGAEGRLNTRGTLILNDDNDAARRTVEQCYRTNKTMVNPIVDWSEDDVWGFLNGNGIQHCCLYDEGYSRLGCIGCPMSGVKWQTRDFKRYPKFKEMYLKAFDRMIKRKAELGKPYEKWKTAEDVMEWWLHEPDNDDRSAGTDSLV